jgi:hypothetical protein
MGLSRPPDGEEPAWAAFFGYGGKRQEPKLLRISFQLLGFRFFGFVSFFPGVVEGVCTGL